MGLIQKFKRILKAKRPPYLEKDKPNYNNEENIENDENQSDIDDSFDFSEFAYKTKINVQDVVEKNLEELAEEDSKSFDRVLDILRKS